MYVEILLKMNNLCQVWAMAYGSQKIEHKWEFTIAAQTIKKKKS